MKPLSYYILWAEKNKSYQHSWYEKQQQKDLVLDKSTVKCHASAIMLAQPMRINIISKTIIVDIQRKESVKRFLKMSLKQKKITFLKKWISLKSK